MRDEIILKNLLLSHVLKFTDLDSESCLEGIPFNYYVDIALNFMFKHSIITEEEFDFLGHTI